MLFLDFEKPIEELTEQLQKMRDVAASASVDLSAPISELEEKLDVTKRKIYSGLSRWQKVQLSRHPARPYTNFYIHHICDSFTELHGDRNFRDDKAIVGGMGMIDGRTVVLIGHQKGSNVKTRQFRNFGMANPEGYRKALRLMKLAEKFNKPVVCLIDTPGAYPGIEGEERGQAEAIARNIFEMAQLKTPIICIIIGEGASGGALGIGVGDRIAMLENTWYSVISPESCSSILWRSWEQKEIAAEQLKPSPTDMKQFRLIDDIIPEPLGGAHNDPNIVGDTVKQYINRYLDELTQLDTGTLVQQRIDRYASMGEFEEI